MIPTLGFFLNKLIKVGSKAAMMLPPIPLPPPPVFLGAIGF
jgi:hypothetical protein